ncbi:hypothetical protein [Actinomadura sp. 3N407]|uniref:hypothetical protein n=1 Tax=Actinomadura sp. 3N407 TaxID=3457423 RepID=UPI003FCC5A0A
MSCATCGGTDLVQRPRALTQFSRGTQLSITSWNQALLCSSCDAAMVARSSEGKPIPPHFQPAAAFKRDPRITGRHPDHSPLTKAVIAASVGAVGGQRSTLSWPRRAGWNDGVAERCDDPAGLQRPNSFRVLPGE